MSKPSGADLERENQLNYHRSTLTLKKDATQHGKCADDRPKSNRRRDHYAKKKGGSKRPNLSAHEKMLESAKNSGEMVELETNCGVLVVKIIDYDKYSLIVEVDDESTCVFKHDINKFRRAK